jgi:hypothetical protein
VNLAEYIMQAITEDVLPVSGSLPACGEFMKRLPTGITQSKEECVICTVQFDLSEAATQLDCGHEFHSSCLRQWFERRSTCPVCRHQYPNDDVQYLRSLGLKDEADRKEAEDPRRQQLEDLRQLIHYALRGVNEPLPSLTEEVEDSIFDCDHCGCSISRSISHYQCLDCSAALCVECYEVGAQSAQTTHDPRHEFTYESSRPQSAVSSNNNQTHAPLNDSYNTLMAELQLIDDNEEEYFAGEEDDDESDISIEEAEEDFEELLRSSGH